MTIEDDTPPAGGAGRAIEETWDRLRQDDPEQPAEDKDDLDQIEDELDDEDDYDDEDENDDDDEEESVALDGEVMDDPVENIGSYSDRGGDAVDGTYRDDDATGIPPARNPF